MTDRPPRIWDDDAAALDRLSANQRRDLYERVRAAGADTEQLQRLDLPALTALARSADLAVVPGAGRRDLLQALLRDRTAQAGLCLCTGVLEVLPDGYGFLRAGASDWEGGADDIYVSPSQIHRLELRSGHLIAGVARPTRAGETYHPLLRVETVDGVPLEQLGARVPFDASTPVLPRERLRLEHPSASPAARQVDLLSPWGRGQRVLIRAPHGCGRARLLADIVAAALAAQDDLSAILCLLDARPEDVTELRRAAGPCDRATVVAATFDRPPDRQLALTDLALARAQRLVESGRHVLLAVDSLTALVRAGQHEPPLPGRGTALARDGAALLRAKRLFAAARSLEGGTSLTLVATALADPSSPADLAVADEFAGKGNADVALARIPSPVRGAPIDVPRTGTRREDQLLQKELLDGLLALRRRLQDRPLGEQLAELDRLLTVHPTNAALLAAEATRR